MELRNYQQAAVNDALEWVKAKETKRLYAAPTGTGKSYVELSLQEQLNSLYGDWWIITPRLEIIRLILEKKRIYPNSLQELMLECWHNQICTPIRFRNAIFSGEIKKVGGLIFDEGHHAIARSWSDISVATGFCPTMLFTATPFRGTPRSTAMFKEEWGEPTWIITIKEAAHLGDICIPSLEILPLVDDELIQLNSVGEFEVTSIESATHDRLSHIAKIAADRWYSKPDGWDRPTVFCLPTVSLAKQMFRELQSLGLPAGLVTQETSYNDRVFIFEALKIKKLALIQIAVVGEGIDLPIRRLIDLSPCMSPVKWLQQFGRATRPIAPTEQPSEYIVTNRNLLRHAYLLEGTCPASKISEAIKLFGSIGTRNSIRAFGLENLGRFKPINIELADDTFIQLYMVVSLGNNRVNEFACIVHPTIPDTVWAKRTHSVVNNEKQWGRWQKCDAPLDLKGFVSQQASLPSPKQETWWRKSAKFYGLKSDIKLNRKVFAILPLLVDLKVRFCHG